MITKNGEPLNVSIASWTLEKPKKNNDPYTSSKDVPQELKDCICDIINKSADRNYEKRLIHKGYSLPIGIIDAILAQDELDKKGISPKKVTKTSTTVSMKVDQVLHPEKQWIHTADEKEANKESLMLFFSNCNLQPLEGLKKSEKKKEKAKRDYFIDYYIREYPQYKKETIETFVKQNILHEWEGTWPQTDYNNAIKRAWRREMKKFIDENTDVHKRKDMKVLCLPGIECLEIPLYRKLKFDPNNIIWVEGSAKDQEAFLKSAKKRRIQAELNSLENFLQVTTEWFDVVSLDFTGEFSGKTLTILSKLKLQPGAIILINLQGRRESKEMQKYLNGLVKKPDIQPNPSEEKLVEITDDLTSMRNEGIPQAIVKNIRNNYQSDPEITDLLKKCRDIFNKSEIDRLRQEIDRLKNRKIKENPWNDKFFIEDNIKNAFLNTAWAHMMRVLTEEAWLACSEYNKLWIEKIAPIIREFMDININQNSWFEKHKMYAYKSASYSPFICHFFVIKEFESDTMIKPFKQTLTFMLVVMKAMKREWNRNLWIKGSSIYITPPSSFKLSFDKEKGCLCCDLDDEKVLRLDFFEFAKEMKQLEHYYNTQPKLDEVREKIEVPKEKSL